jgi:hypothetical protein
MLFSKRFLAAGGKSGGGFREFWELEIIVEI